MSLKLLHEPETEDPILTVVNLIDSCSNQFKTTLLKLGDNAHRRMVGNGDRWKFIIVVEI